MRKYSNLILTAFLIFVFTFTVLGQNSVLADPPPKNPTTQLAKIDSPDEFISKGKAQSNTSEGNTIKAKTDILVDTLQKPFTYIGLAILIIMVIYVGIQYMSASTAEQKVKVKDSMFPLIISGIILSGGLAIFNIIKDLLDSSF